MQTVTVVRGTVPLDVLIIIPTANGLILRSFLGKAFERIADRRARVAEWQKENGTLARVERGGKNKEDPPRRPTNTQQQYTPYSFVVSLLSLSLKPFSFESPPVRAEHSPHGQTDGSNVSLCFYPFRARCDGRGMVRTRCGACQILRLNYITLGSRTRVRSAWRARGERGDGGGGKSRVRAKISTGRLVRRSHFRRPA